LKKILTNAHWIGKGEWKKVIEKIKAAIKRNNNRPPKMERAFYENFLEWIEKKLEQANIIMVEGNL
jgi:Zn-finger nucleic acid-binding protein